MRFYNDVMSSDHAQCGATPATVHSFYVLLCISTMTRVYGALVFVELHMQSIVYRWVAKLILL